MCRLLYSSSRYDPKLGSLQVRPVTYLARSHNRTSLRNLHLPSQYSAERALYFQAVQVPLSAGPSLSYPGFLACLDSYTHLGVPVSVTLFWFFKNSSSPTPGTSPSLQGTHCEMRRLLPVICIPDREERNLDFFLSFLSLSLSISHSLSFSLLWCHDKRKEDMRCIYFVKCRSINSRTCCIFLVYFELFM